MIDFKWEQLTNLEYCGAFSEIISFFSFLVFMFKITVSFLEIVC